MEIRCIFHIVLFSPYKPVTEKGGGEDGDNEGDQEGGDGWSAKVRKKQEITFSLSQELRTRTTNTQCHVLLSMRNIDHVLQL